MKPTVSITQSLPYISVIQGTYRWLFSTGETPTCQEETVSGISIGSWIDLFPSPLKGVEFSVHSIADDWLKFQNLVRRWRTERGATSSITEMATCQAYQSIIGMGEKAIPFIISELESEGEEPDQWFWALQALTGENPVKTEDRGDFLKMAQSWLEWAKNE